MCAIAWRVQVVVMEVKDLSCLSSNKIVYCTMEVDGGDKLQTDQAEASKPWSVSVRIVFMTFYLIMAVSSALRLCAI